MVGNKVIGAAGVVMLFACVVFLTRGDKRLKPARGDSTKTLTDVVSASPEARGTEDRPEVAGGILALIESGTPENLRDRVRAGAALNDTDASAVTPLHRAAELGRLEMIHVLTEAGADVTAANKVGKTPTDVAADTDAGTLLNLVKKYRKGDWGTLSRAIVDKDKDAAEFLVATGADIDGEFAGGPRPLEAAVQARQTELVALLLKSGAEINFKRNNGKPSLLLHEAAGREAADIMRMLVERGADIAAEDHKGCSVLHATAGLSDQDAVAIAELLISRGADPRAKDKNDYTPLHEAARRGRKALAKFLIASGADVRAPNLVGRTPLHVAASTASVDVVQLLIGSGADVNAADLYKNTPMHSAAMASPVDRALATVEYLAAQGAIVDAPGENGNTPLFRAVGLGRTAMAELLIRLGAQVNRKNAEGNTPLHEAVEVGRKEMVAFLLDHGADPSATGKDHLTPLQLALKAEAAEIAALLKKRGATP